MPGRSYATANTNYRFGFNGKELDKESPVQYAYGFRIYDPRLARFKSVDPITKDYPELTPYQFASNSPISGIDLDGLEYYYTSSGALLGKYGTSTEVRVVNAEFVKKTYGIKTPISEFNKNSHSVGLTNAELNTRAFLGTITRLEDGGYHKKIGGGTFEGDEHPGGQKLRFGKKHKYVSAAGAYQITEGTYKGYKALDKTITNFSSENQDKIAVDIIDATKALGDVKAGNVNSAATKLTSQWSSLPGASEQTHSLEETKKIFKEQVSKELNNNSDISTPQGQLDLNEKKSK